MSADSGFRLALMDWYARNGRDLPWRRTSDPYAIWLSEIMLQQTRVAAVLPYYEKFLHRFPDAASLAAAPEHEVLTLWAGLGYYSRARNLMKAAQQIVAHGSFPHTYQAIRELAGIGEYTAAAIASIAFGLPHAVVDGNVLRVISRLQNDPSDISATKTRRNMQIEADRLLDHQRPAIFNQAMMELGATLCLPRQPQCLLCPVGKYCQARQAGTQSQLPVKVRNTEVHKLERTLVLIRRKDAFLLWQRKPDSAKLAGFWELPEASQIPQARLGPPVGSFRHSITNHQYVFHVVPGRLRVVPDGFAWVSPGAAGFPISTTTRKAISVFNKEE